MKRRRTERPCQRVTDLSKSLLIEAYIVAAADGDQLGLHELPSAVSRRTPELEEAEIYQLCRATCRDLLERGCIQLVSTPAFAARPGRDGFVAISSAEALEIVSDDQNWHLPAEAKARYWLVATDEGRAEYISESKLSL